MTMQLTKEYRQFLMEVLQRKITAYEKLCRAADKIGIPPGKDLEKKYWDAINFAHLEMTPRGAFSFAIYGSLAFSIFFILLSILFGAFSFLVVFLVGTFGFMIFYYLYNYPLHVSTMFRISASSEMVLGIVYMTISMRITPNLENAVKFAADNLSGPLAYDLRKMIWDLYTRKFDNITQALKIFGEKWRRENEEFVGALNLLQNSLSEDPFKRERTLDEAVSVMLMRTKERMEHYAHQLRSPVTVLNAMGILLPIIGLAFFPMVSVFMPEIAQPVFLAVGYDAILPLTVYWMMKSTLDKRPYSFYHPDISKHPKFKRQGFFGKAFFLAIVAAAIPIGFAAYMISISGPAFSFELLAYSIMAIGGIAAGVVTYAFLSTNAKLKLRTEIVKIEGEFSEALFQLGNQLARGVPIEKSLSDITPKIKDMKISQFFNIILQNMKNMGMTFEAAIFDRDYGAINFYPSRTIEAVMRAVVEISMRGMDAASKAMISVSSYLKDVRSVEEDLQDILSESTSTMNIQALLLAPLTSGIVVALAAMMMQIMVYFSSMLAKIQKMVTGPFGSVGGGFMNSLISINSMMPVHVFQAIVGLYMLEVVGMLAVFVSIINNGEESLMKRSTVGKFILIGTIIYILVSLAIYQVFLAIMPITGLGGSI
jgi:hypothetical protein